MSYKMAAIGTQNRSGTHRVRECILHHFRRVLVVASLYFRLKGTQTPTQDEVERINRTFNLVLRPSAVLFPAAISTWVWKRIDVKTFANRIRECRADVLACHAVVLSTLPKWMQYPGVEDDVSVVVGLLG